VILNKREKLTVAAIAAVLLLLAGTGFLLLNGRGGNDDDAIQRRANTLTLVRTYVEKEEFDRALSLLENLLIENPDDGEASELLDIVLAAKRARDRIDAGEPVDRTELEEALAAARDAAARIASAADEAWRAASRISTESRRDTRGAAADSAQDAAPSDGDGSAERQPADTTATAAVDGESDRDAVARMEKEQAAREEAERKALEENLAKKNAEIQKRIEEVNRNVAQGKQAAESGSYRSARDSFNRAAAALPEGEDAFNTGKYLEMAESLLGIAEQTDDSTIKTEALSGALEYANEALRADPSSANAYWLRSRIYDGQGKDDQALADLAEAVRLDGKKLSVCV